MYVEWARSLHGRSGIGFGGVAPLSPVVLEAWRVAMDLGDLHPLEVEALMYLDAAMFDAGEPEQEKVTLPPYQRHAWPTRKES